MSDNKREFEQLPEWLQDCWKLAPAIARRAEKYIEGLKPLSSHAVLGDGWRDVRKELPVTPFLAYWTDGRMTVLEEGDSVAYAIVGNPDKRVIGWIPLSEIGKPAFA